MQTTDTQTGNKQMNKTWICKTDNSIKLTVIGSTKKSVICLTQNGEETTFPIRFFLQNMTPAE
jgi:hypothetical protein